MAAADAMQQVVEQTASVQRLWAASHQAASLAHLQAVERHKRFEEKFWGVIGLYLNPPDKALVLCCDEKSQCRR